MICADTQNMLDEVTFVRYKGTHTTSHAKGSHMNQIVTIQSDTFDTSTVQHVAQAAQVGQATPSMVDLLRNYWTANRMSNTANRIADKAKRDLHKAMAAAGVTEFSETVVVDGGASMVEAKIDSPNQEVISVEKLRQIVDDATFMRIVKATKTAVVAEAGTNVAVMATIVEPGKTDLRIRELKG